jgi:hypothetical protein
VRDFSKASISAALVAFYTAALACEPMRPKL